MTDSPSQITTPEWQDDSEVTSCSICHRRFHFLFRKHHCRKCGQVVCDQCSSHRLDLPKRLIVRPPWDSSVPTSPILEQDDLYVHSQQDSSEVVRVCDPCKADTKVASVCQIMNDTGSGPISVSPSVGPADAIIRARTFHGPRRSPERAQPSRYQSTQLDQTISPARRRPDRRISDAPYVRDSGEESVTAQTLGRPRVVRTPNARQHRVVSGSAPQARYMQPFRISGPGSPPRINLLSKPGNYSAPKPSHVNDEDLCPVCRTSNFPFGPMPSITQGERPDMQGQDRRQIVQKEREKHVENCIVTFFTPRHRPVSYEPDRRGSPIRSGTFSNGRITRQYPNQASGPQARPDDPNVMHDPFVVMNRFQQQQPRHPTGLPREERVEHQQEQQKQHNMLIYIATDKDCQIDDGLDQPDLSKECIICLEEFEPGQALARLECFCKFHKGCIMEWWETNMVPKIPAPTTERTIMVLQDSRPIIPSTTQPSSMLASMLSSYTGNWPLRSDASQSSPRRLGSDEIVTLDSAMNELSVTTTPSRYNLSPIRTFNIGSVSNIASQPALPTAERRNSKWGTCPTHTLLTHFDET